MKTLILLPNTLCEQAYLDIRRLKINKVVIILDSFYMNESQHIQKLVLIHCCIERLDFNIPTFIVSEYKPKVKEQCFIYEPLDVPIYKKYSYCTMLNNPTIMLSRSEIFDMPLFTKQSEFYKFMRKKFDILMEGSKPKSGRWSFDVFNRSKFPKKYVEGKPFVEQRTQLFDDIRLMYPNAYGNSSELYYPSSFNGAKNWLKKFIKTKLENFGKYQDAFDPYVQLGEHSNISALMNIGLLTPRYVIKKVLETNSNIESIEGFIRQIIGWREYMRYVYLRMPNIKKSKYLKQLGNGKIPIQWYKGTTGIEIFDVTISKILKTGYAHHIERLMVLNNSMVMYGFSHKEIYKWFMRMFVDSYEWVMLGCVYMNHNSLSESKDESRYMGRAYFSSGNYIKKMSSYRGASIDIFNALFETFTKEHAQLLKRDYMLASYVTKKMQHA